MAAGVGEWVDDVHWVRLAAIVGMETLWWRNAVVTQVIQLDGVGVTLDSSWVSVAGRSVRLSGQEAALLHALATEPGQVLSKAELVQRAWGPTRRVSINAVEVYVSYLRRKLGQLGIRHLLRTVYGRGYQLAGTGHRRPTPKLEAAKLIQLGGLDITLSGWLVSVAGRSVELTERETALLQALSTPPGRVLSKAELVARVWGPTRPVTINAVEVCIGSLRRKLDQIGVRHLLCTVPRRGYQLAEPRGHPPTQQWVTQVLQLSGVDITLAATRISAADRSVPLTEREAALLHALATPPGRLISKAELLRRVWGHTPDMMRINNVETHISYLRRKLDRIGARPLLRTVRGAGYYLAATSPDTTPPKHHTRPETSDAQHSLPAAPADTTPTNDHSADQ